MRQLHDVVALSALSLLITNEAAASPTEPSDSTVTKVPRAPPSTSTSTSTTTTNKAHFLGLRGNFGSRAELGVGYLHAHEFAHSGPPPSFFYGWIGYGGDVRYVLGRDALLGCAVGRLSTVAHGGFFGVELTLGAGSAGDGLQGAGSVGAYLSGYYGELGYTFQFPMGPFDRPDWLGAHFFSVRAHVPLYRYDRKSSKEEWKSRSP